MKNSILSARNSLFLLLLAGSTALMQSARAGSFQFAPTGNLITARAAHTATLLPNDKVLVAGGINFSDGYLSGAELYDPTTGTWSQTGSLNAPRSGHTATLLSDGRVLVAGGSNSMEAGLRSAELYDPDTGMWTPTGRLNYGRV